MAGIRAVVYDPPGGGFPYIAVVIGPNGDVLIAEAVVSREQGKHYLAKILNEFARAVHDEKQKS